MPKEFSGDKPLPFKTVGKLIADGQKLPPLAPLKWTKGQGGRQAIYLCYSSGTSGLPVGYVGPGCVQMLKLIYFLERRND